MEKLKDLESIGVYERRGVVRRELGEKVADGVLAYCFWHVVEERAERDSLCVLERGGWDGQVRKGCGRDEQTSVWGESAQNRWQRIYGKRRTGTGKFHVETS